MKASLPRFRRLEEAKYQYFKASYLMIEGQVKGMPPFSITKRSMDPTVSATFKQSPKLFSFSFSSYNELNATTRHSSDQAASTSTPTGPKVALNASTSDSSASSITANSSISASTLLISEQLPVNQWLTHTKEFMITNCREGKYIACGERVRVFPALSQFRIRILNMDYYNGGKLKEYVEFSKKTFDLIMFHGTEILRLATSVKFEARQQVFEHEGLTVSVVSKRRIEFRRDGECIQMIIDTFNKMTSWKDQIEFEYLEFEKRQQLNSGILNEILNMMAYIANGEKVNDEVREPAATNKAAILRTYRTLYKQSKRAIMRDTN